MASAIFPEEEDLDQVADAEEQCNQNGGIVGAEFADQHGTHKGAGADDDDREGGEDGRRNDQLILPPLVNRESVARVHIIV